MILSDVHPQVGYVPIPRIEYTDDQLDLVIENLTFQGRNIFPNVVSMNASNFIKFSPYNTIGDEAHHEFTFTFGQIQADMRDVAFYFRKKSGFPKLTDQGLADVLLGGQGLTVRIPRFLLCDRVTDVYAGYRPPRLCDEGQVFGLQGQERQR